MKKEIICPETYEDILLEQQLLIHRRKQIDQEIKLEFEQHFPSPVHLDHLITLANKTTQAINQYERMLKRIERRRAFKAWAERVDTHLTHVFSRLFGFR